jgi:hypothetical protein
MLAGCHIQVVTPQMQFYRGEFWRTSFTGMPTLIAIKADLQVLGLR